MPLYKWPGCGIMYYVAQVQPSLVNSQGKQILFSACAYSRKVNVSDCPSDEVVIAVYTLHTTHYTLPTIHYTLHTPHYTLHNTHYPLHTTHYTLHTTHYTPHTAQCVHNKQAYQGSWSSRTEHSLQTSLDKHCMYFQAIIAMPQNAR